MACDITQILEDFNKVIDTSIKGNAESITQVDNNTFEVRWGDQFMVKTKPQAVHMVEKKIETTNNKLSEEGFHRSFGPYLEMDMSSDEVIVIKKKEPTKLTRALELRNTAEDQGVAVDELLTDVDKELLKNDEVNEVVHKFEEIEEGNIIPEALKHADEINNGMFKEMFKSDPHEFLKFVSDQYYSNLEASFSGKATFGSGIEDLPDSIVSAARKLYPQESKIKPPDLPAINLEC